MMTLQQIKNDQAMCSSSSGRNNPVVGIPEMLNTITDMLAIANIKNVGRYFKTPSPQVLQAMQTAPKEPDAMTIAAKANYERVKNQTAKAMGDQQFNAQKQAQDEAFRRDKLAQEAGLRGREDPGAGGRARPRPSGRHGPGRRRHGQGVSPRRQPGTTTAAAALPEPTLIAEKRSIHQSNR